ACDGLVLYPLFLHVALLISEPFVPPLHVTLVTTCVVVIGGGCVIVTDVVAVHPLLSVTVNVYVPAVSPACDGVIVYPGVPPLGVITTEPFVPPLHVTLVTTCVVVIGGGCVIVTDVVAVHPLLSVTVNVYVPAVSPACDGVIVYPGVPPLGVIATEQFVPPLHFTFVITC